MTAATHILAQLSEYARPGYWYGVLALIAFYVVAIFLAALLEKRDTRQYADARALPPGTSLNPYVAATNERAADLGFTYGGSFKHPKYDVQVSVWISDDHLTLIGTGAGTILTRPVRQTDVFTRTTDGVVLDTCDYYGGGDLSGFLKLAQHYHGSLDDLLALHRKRIERSTAEPIPFVERSPLDAVNAIYTERTERLIRRGRARYIAADGKRWRYTPRGAMLQSLSFFPQLGHALMRPWREYRPRPGVLTLPQPLDPARYGKRKLPPSARA